MPFELLAAVVACACLAFVCWLLSVITREYSWVDRIWSVVPPLYVGWFAYAAHFADARLNLVFALTLAWGIRLTFNFTRKGGYKAGGEDYRWAVLRARFGPVWFQVFNATFIAPYQNLILLLIALPAFHCFQHPTPLQPLDFVAVGLFALLLVGETVADEQQWRFYKRKQAGEALDFNSEGLFRYSRHPNFFCEQGMWWCVYAFSVAAGGLNWTIIGAILLTLLFQGSTNFTEKISASKYPRYREYQKTTSRLVPLP